MFLTITYFQLFGVTRRDHFAMMVHYRNRSMFLKSLPWMAFLLKSLLPPGFLNGDKIVEFH